MNDALPTDIALESSILWTWIVPVLLFAVAFSATWLLYRHFARKGGGS